MSVFGSLLAGFVIGFVFAMWLFIHEDGGIEEEVRHLKVHAEQIVKEVENTLKDEVAAVKNSRAVEALKRIRPDAAISDIRVAVELAYRKIFNKDKK